MEITYQNKTEDLYEYFEHFLRKTKQGKQFKISQFLSYTLALIFSIEFFWGIAWFLSKSWKDGLTFSLYNHAIVLFIILIITKFKYFNDFGKRYTDKTVASWNTKDKQIFHLPKTLKISSEWLELQCSEYIHRWRWRSIHKIETNANFCFIYINKDYTLVIPKRSFSSEQGFIEFINQIQNQLNSITDQIIGSA